MLRIISRQLSSTARLCDARRQGRRAQLEATIPTLYPSLSQRKLSSGDTEPIVHPRALPPVAPSRLSPDDFAQRHGALQPGSLDAASSYQLVGAWW